MKYNWKTGLDSPQLPTRLETLVGTNLKPGNADWIAAGWLLDDIAPFVCPEGYVVIPGTQTVETDADVDPERAWYVSDTRTIAEQQAIDAAAEAARVAALAGAYGETVGAFAARLAVFGLSMPITMEDATEAMYEQIKYDATKSADSQMAMLVYEGLKMYLSDDDIVKVWELINAG